MIIEALPYDDFVKKTKNSNLNESQQYFNDLNNIQIDKCFELKCIK
jgi:hypothetical protein